MNQQQTLIKILADRQWHSGEQLAAHFELSRTAIWKRIAQLRAEGLTIESDRGKGYRLLDRVDWFDANTLASYLVGAAVQSITQIDAQLLLGSTNKACLGLLARREGTAAIDLSGYVMLAEQQTAGQGRRGRTWVSPLGCNVYMSLIWRFEAGAGSLAGLSLVVGLALVKALEHQGYRDLTLKWPNDVLWQNRKLAGVLLEVSGDVSGACDVVIGIGVNVAMPSEPGADIDQPWVDLTQIDKSRVPDKNRIVADLLNQLVPDIQQFQQAGFTAFKEQWSSRDHCAGQSVQMLLGPGQDVAGAYCGVNDDGSIGLETNEGRQNFSGGEISLRRV